MLKIFKSKRGKESTRDPCKRSVVWYGNWGNENDLSCAGYTSLSSCPEVVSAVDRIASLVSSMTICLMQNGDDGDLRIKNELSRIVDIAPTKYMTRSNWVYWIVKTMLLSGNGNAVVLPITEDGYIRRLQPIPPSYVSFVPNGLYGYNIAINGMMFDPDDVLHFAINPSDIYPWLGTGYRVSLSDITNNLKQATETEKGFMQSKWKPSIIVKVDALTDEFASPEGRKKLLEEYIDSSEAGEPWLIPGEQFEVEQIKPLTLADLALSDFVEIDKKTVASILGVPSFVLGVGDFRRDEWNNFITTKIMFVAQILEQELTRKILYSPNMFFRFNSRSLYNYDLKDMAAVADDQFVRGIMTGNEVRNWIGLPPLDGLNELVILENYIPRGMIGDQSKLTGSGD